MTPLDAWQDRWPLVALRLYVDDVSLQQPGTVRFLTDQFPSAAFDPIRSLESSVGCLVSVSSASGLGKSAQVAPQFQQSVEELERDVALEDVYPLPERVHPLRV